MEENPIVEHCIYWRNLDSKNINRHGMLFYTPDSYMIFGISRDSFGLYNKENEEECLREMKSFLGVEEGYITYECPTEDNFTKFMALVKQYNKT